MVDQEKIHDQSLSDDPKERKYALEQLKNFFSFMPDKQQAWNDLIKLTSDEHDYVRYIAADTLASVFSQVPDKKQMWDDLVKLISDKDSDAGLRVRAANAFHYAFSYMPDKQWAWNDLHRLTTSEDNIVREYAAFALGAAFSQVPDKKQAWDDLFKLIHDEHYNVRFEAVQSFDHSMFFQVSDKLQAWSDLYRLINDEDNWFRLCAACVLESVFSQIPDKQQAWNELVKLTNDKDWEVKYSAVSAFGSLFSQVPDKQQAWNDLTKLATDEDCLVRIYVNHSLGRVSIFKASQAETDEDYEKELERAIKFFEKAAYESLNSKWGNPSQFCLPFYRSFHTIIFKKHDAKEEVGRCLAEAKSVIEGSKSKKQLLEAVENLAKALTEVQNLRDLDLEAKKSELNLYRQYCDCAAELIRNTEETVPYATVAMRKGMHILDRNLKELLEEIQKKAKAVCKQTKGTPAESLGLETNKAAKELSELFNCQTLNDAINEQIEDSINYCDFILPGKKTQFRAIIEETKNIDINKDLDLLKKLDGMKQINDFILRNALFPRIKEIHIADRIKENVRIATVQLNYALSNKFPYRIKDEDKGEVKNKILNALKTAQEEEVNILCLPELCNCEEWLPEIRESCKNIIVISGTYYDNENHNICKLITDLDVEITPQLKLIPSDFEGSNLIGQRMVPGEKILNVYESQFGKFAILICRDFGNFSSCLKGIADVILCPSYNEANERFHSIAHSHVTDSPSYIIISNTAQYGGTSIFGRMKKGLFGALEQCNYKEKGDTSYKLCQIEKGKEGMIIADFNLIYKSPPLQTPMNPDEEVMPVKNIKKLTF